MKLSIVKMAKGFGELARVRGIVYFRLSPFEQKAFAGAIKKGVPNTIRRFAENFWTVVPPFVVSYFIYDYYEKLAQQMLRKNPEDFACDK